MVGTANFTERLLPVVSQEGHIVFISSTEHHHSVCAGRRASTGRTVRVGISLLAVQQVQTVIAVFLVNSLLYFAHMEPNVQQKLQEIEAKIDALYISTEKTRRYFQIVAWITIAMVVLPLIGLVFAIPSFINTYTATMDGLL